MISNGPSGYKRRVLQSPMCGCSDLTFREIAREHGCELAFCEMVKDDAVVRGNEKTRHLLASGEFDHPLGMQLVGREPDTMAEAARILESLGADEVNVNLGCPVPKIVKGGCGAALLREPEQVGRILQAMVRAVRIPVTVKMRTGWTDAEDNAFLEVARIAAGVGAAAITVHGRTRQQMYAGFSNLETIRAVVEAVDVPVIGNGDLRCGADAVRMVESTGCAAVMIARGALGNPWIYREAAAALAGEPAPSAPTVADRVQVLERHFLLARARYGDFGACIRIRKVIGWYSANLEHAASIRSRGNLVAGVSDFRAVIEYIYANNDAHARPVMRTSVVTRGEGECGAEPDVRDAAAVNSSPRGC